MRISIKATYHKKHLLGIKNKKDPNFLSKDSDINPVVLLNKLELKNTDSRIHILDILLKTRGPISASEIFNKLSKKVNLTTIYRFLDILVKQGLIQKTNFGQGRDYFEYQSSHHHHIVCRTCGLKEPIKLPKLERFLKHNIIGGNSNFPKIDEHLIEFFGYCRRCVK